MEEIQVVMDKMVKSVIRFGNHKAVLVEHQVEEMAVQAVIGRLDQEQVLVVVAVVDPH
jgi:hypothetical protein